MLLYLILWLTAVKCIAEIQENSESVFNNDPVKSIAEIACNSSDSNDPSQIEEAAKKMFEEYWEIFLMMNPDYATALGDQRYDSKLSSYSFESIEKMKVIIEEFIQRAIRLLARAVEGSETQNNLELFKTNLEYRLSQFTAGSYLFPISKLSTPEKNLRSLIKYMTLNSTQQFRNLIARYRAMPKQIDEIIELMREGIRRNFTLNEKSVFSDDSKWKLSSEDFFYKPFTNISSIVSESEIEEIQENARNAIRHSLVPAFQNLADFMKNEYRPHLRPEIGVRSLPNGADFYKRQLAFHLTDISVTPQEIHQMGLSEVTRITDEMKEVIRSLGLDLTPQEFSDYVRNDPSQFFSSEEEALSAYREVMFNVLMPKLPVLFDYVPQKKLKVEKVPKEVASGPRAYYMRPSPDNSTPGIFYLDTSSLENIPKYEVMTLSMHEGVPGHHFQISYAMEQTQFPNFRKYDVHSSAFTEGWGLYAEYLGYELDVYEDPYMRYGHLSQEIFRACRMVVDTGMHFLGWSRQQAINYMMKNTAYSLSNIEREVDRYITWPGQACAYKYGQIKLKELRKKAHLALGNAFDLKKFHDVILFNNGPMEFVEKQVDRYTNVLWLRSHT